MSSMRKLNSTVTRIGTHNGVFHCDEVLACFMLKQLAQYKDTEIIRTRDQEILDGCDIIVDVGGVYNPKINLFDHHQKSFTHTLSSVRPDLAKNKNIRLSSAGLVYAHFGVDVLKEIYESRGFLFTPEEIERLYLAVYDTFIEEIDAIDNGVPMYQDGTPQYSIGTHLSARVGMLNPSWNEKETPNIDKLFYKAMELVGSEFVNKILQIGTVWFPARKIVKNSMDNRLHVHESGQIVELEKQCPWKAHLLELEKEMDIENEIKFLIFHDNLNNTWRVQAVPNQPDSFICRIFLHKDWQGIRDEELSKLSGIDGCIFVHSTGFIGGNKTRDGALQMALKSINA